MNKLVKLSTLMLILLSTSILRAHPVSYEDGYALMTETSSSNQELMFTYSPKWWFGTGAVLDRRTDERELISLQLAYLVKRWNLPGAQGNVYVFGGPGFARTGLSSVEEDGSFYRYGIQADFETRRIYTAARYIENRFFDENNRIYDRLDLAAGFAPYLANFNELNSWVILRLRTNSKWENVALIPTLRFFYKNFLWEIGQDLDGNSNLNFMVRY